MQASRLILAAALTTAAFVAQAETPDPSGQFAQRVSGPAVAQTSPAAAAQATSGKTRAQVQAEYIANRNAVAALNGEDSGSAYLAKQRATNAR
jgi:hypothetical protein